MRPFLDGSQRDQLTGLPTRTGLILAAAASDWDRGATCILLDLDGFKHLRDAFGEILGARALEAIARNLQQQLSPPMILARVGHDEFAVLLHALKDDAMTNAFAERLVAAIETPIIFGDHAIVVSATYGVATNPRGAPRIKRLLKGASLALYQAKAHRRRLVRSYMPEIRHLAAERLKVGADLKEAWDRDEFELYFQPQVELSTGRVVGAEALIRWNHAERGLLAPAAFLAALEEHQDGTLALAVGDWILHTACRHGATWRAQVPGFRIAVNLFAVQLETAGLAAAIARALEASGLAPGALEIEVTENIILRSERLVPTVLTEIARMGVGIAFDDFGTGFASLSLLRDYPVNRLKIDRSFVQSILANPRDQAIVRAMVVLAAGLGLEVVAEGIETKEQATFMGDEGCRIAQGYAFGRPMPADRFDALLRRPESVPWPVLR